MPGAAFPKRLRLREPAQFSAVFDAAEVRLSAGEVLLLARRNTLDHPRLGVVIGRKVCRHAAGRNRFKRAVRESYRLRQAELGGLDIIVLARAGVARLEPPLLRERIESLWPRLAKRLNSPAP
jgi:ribonuclease P protein component